MPTTPARETLSPSFGDVSVPCFDGRVRELLWLELGFFLRSDLRRLLGAHQLPVLGVLLRATHGDAPAAIGSA
jgi:hypothetical protein